MVKTPRTATTRCCAGRSRSSRSCATLHGAPAGVSILNKRIGAGTTAALTTSKPARAAACLGPLGRPFEPVDPPAEAWMIAGGVGLAPFVTLADALAAPRHAGRRSSTAPGAAADLTAPSSSSALGVRIVLATEDGSRGAQRLHHRPAEAALGADGRSAIR